MSDFTSEVKLAIPAKLETLQLPAPELLVYYKDLERRVLWIDYEIDESLLHVVKQILLWNREDAGIPPDQRKPIYMLLFSPGGDLDATLSCADTMGLSETPIVSVSMGQAYSGGLVLLLAGHQRYCLPNATAMLHSGSSMIGGTASQVVSYTQYYKGQLERLKQYILGRTKITSAMYKRKSEEDWWFSAEDQLKYGIVQEIVSSIGQITGSN